jgi:glutamate/tyrosine decarboxylase-like PLP-dependent enzyme
MLNLPAAERRELWNELIRLIETYIESVDDLKVSPPLDPEALRASLTSFDFEQPMPSLDAVRFAAGSLTEFQVHTPHPRYYGLFNPAPTTMGIAADALVAAFNPQLAAWSHSPFAAEVERHLIQQFGVRFGYEESSIDGTFCTGGAEANHTGVLTALTRTFPAFGQSGARGLSGQPTLYVTSDSHDSLRKAARVCGIGADAVRIVPVDSLYRMDLSALSSMIADDKRDGCLPFLLIGTAGTTGSGVVDPLHELADVAWRESLWFHVDAAWGGAAVFAPSVKAAVSGIERADSITFDAHKWLSVPMAAGVFLTRHPQILIDTFETKNAYMPRDASGLNIVDPFSHSLQWSRRFTGLKVFLSLLVAGWSGYREALEQQIRMGNLLRKRLGESGWRIINNTPLPLVCFVPDDHSVLADQPPINRPKIDRPTIDRPAIDRIVQHVVRSGEAWISSTILGGRDATIRACITNYRTTESDVEALIETLSRARAAAI